MRKIIRRTLTALLIVASLLTAAIVGAAIQTFDGHGEWHTSDAENQQIAMARASQRAKLNAQEKAGVYLKTFSRSINSELADDAISAVTNNILEVVGKVNYDQKIIQLSDQQTTILYTATLKARIDTDGIYAWLKRDNKEKITIIQQNTQLQDAIQKNDKLAENLQEQYNRAKSQAERDRILKQMTDADKRFLATQKIEEGIKLGYSIEYGKEDELACYSKAIEIDPTCAEAYFYRGICHIRGSFGFLIGKNAKENSALALEDFSKAIELNPDYTEAYHERAHIYRFLDNYEQAIADYSKIIKLKPDDYSAYKGRGFIYDYYLNDDKRAIADYSKVIKLSKNIEINSIKSMGYSNRAKVYERMKNYKAAIADYSKAIEINPDSLFNYNWRGELYFKLKDYNHAIADFTKSIEVELGNKYHHGEDPKTWSDMDKRSICHVYENRAKAYESLEDYDKAIADYSKAIEIAPYARVYKYRGLCYQKLGDEEKAQADLAKAKELYIN